MRRGNKFGAKKVVVDGETFDSKKEHRRWCELKILERAGEISGLERQVPIRLMGQNGPIVYVGSNRKAKYVADFRYFDHRTGAWVIEDAKGHATPDYLLKRAILRAMGIDILET